MPELPEVRFLVANLQKEILGSTVSSMYAYHASIVTTPEDKKFTLTEANLYLSGLFSAEAGNVSFVYKIFAISRRGKYIIIQMDAIKEGQKVLHLVWLLHLGFTGWLIPTWAEKKYPVRFNHQREESEAKLVIETDRGVLILTDPRVLSRSRFFSSMDAVNTSRFLNRMGPDADSDEGKKALIRAVANTNRRIRDVILDQQVASGIGNYLSAEVLYRAGLNGHERAGMVAKTAMNRLLLSIAETISIAEAQDSHDWWAVFQRKKCPKGHDVTREEWGSRGHYVCYECQGKPS